MYGNSQVVCPFACAGTILYSGALPRWITIDQANKWLAGAAMTFYGPSKAQANAAAQSALDSFVASAITAGTLTCSSVTPPSGQFFMGCLLFSMANPTANPGCEHALCIVESNSSIWYWDNNLTQWFPMIE